MRCLLPTGIRLAEGWRGTSFPYIQKQFATLVSRQQDILICLYAVKQSLAAQCLSQLFLMPAPRAGWGDYQTFERSSLWWSLLSRQLLASRPTLLCPPPAPSHLGGLSRQLWGG